MNTVLTFQWSVWLGIWLLSFACLIPLLASLAACSLCVIVRSSSSLRISELSVAWLIKTRPPELGVAPFWYTQENGYKLQSQLEVNTRCYSTLKSNTYMKVWWQAKILDCTWLRQNQLCSCCIILHWSTCTYVIKVNFIKVSYQLYQHCLKSSMRKN